MHIASLYRYPVKGLTPEPLERTSLVAGETLPFDRAWAIENGQGRFDPAAPRHLPKINFLMLMRDERLATLRTQFDDATETLTILRDGKQVARGQLTTPLGRQLIEQFVGAYMRAELRGPPKIVHAPGHSFSDVAAKCVHVVNPRQRARAGAHPGSAHPTASSPFRANVYLERVGPWAEFGWMGKEGIGEARLSCSRGATLVRGDQRCPRARQMAVPADLQRTPGHPGLRVYPCGDWCEIIIGAAGRPRRRSRRLSAQRLALPSETMVKTSTLRSASSSPTTGRKSL